MSEEKTLPGEVWRSPSGQTALTVDGHTARAWALPSARHELSGDMRANALEAALFATLARAEAAEKRAEKAEERADILQSRFESEEAARMHAQTVAMDWEKREWDASRRARMAEADRDQARKIAAAERALRKAREAYADANTPEEAMAVHYDACVKADRDLRALGVEP